MINNINVERWWNGNWQWRTEVLIEKPVPVPFHPRHNAFLLIVLGCRKLHKEKSGFEVARTSEVRVSSAFLPRQAQVLSASCLQVKYSCLSLLMVLYWTYFDAEIRFCDFLVISVCWLDCTWSYTFGRTVYESRRVSRFPLTVLCTLGRFFPRCQRTVILIPPPLPPLTFRVSVTRRMYAKPTALDCTVDAPDCDGE